LQDAGSVGGAAFFVKNVIQGGNVAARGAGEELIGHRASQDRVRKERTADQHPIMVRAASSSWNARNFARRGTNMATGNDPMAGAETLLGYGMLGLIALGVLWAVVSWIASKAKPDKTTRRGRD